MDFDEVIAKRRSARDFTAEPISKDVLMDVVQQAQRTPSWANSQPWKVYIATGETLAAIKRQHAELSSKRGAWSIGTSGAQPLGMGNRPAT
jgi:oxygen-insensitive NAD(P)H nitroreductase